VAIESKINIQITPPGMKVRIPNPLNRYTATVSPTTLAKIEEIRVSGLGVCLTDSIK
jgi:hypothetical protein